MKNRRFILLAVLAGALAVLLYSVFQGTPQEVAARQHLNDLLGQASANEPQPEQEPFKLPESDHSLFGFPMPTTDITVEETSSNYVLRIPLASPEDSSAVKLNVTPHRIEVSGQTGSKTDGQSFSSSFMQAFSTSQEVLPDQVHRLTEQNGGKTELVITIPKKAGSEAKTIPDYPGLDDEPVNGPFPEEGGPPPLQPPPENNGSPLDTFSNRVI